MDSRRVSAQIKSDVWPTLREDGFSKFSERNAWRYTDAGVHVINFQSFSSHLAERVGATTYSFALNLGISFSSIPPVSGSPPFPNKGPPKPYEYECHFRASLKRTFDQPELDRRDIWYIDAAGIYLARSISDVRGALETQGLPWFEKYGAVLPALELLRSPVLDDPKGGVWGFGNPGSPIRDYMTGYLALAAGRREVACSHLRRAASFFKSNAQLVSDVANCA